MSKPTILLALPGRLFRESLSTALQHHLSAAVIEAGTGEEVFSAIDESHPSVLLIDSNLPGINTMEIIRHIAVYCSTVRTIAICLEANAEVAFMLKKAGAQGFVSYRFSHDLLFRAVSEVRAGRQFFPDGKSAGEPAGEDMVPAEEGTPMIALTRKELEIATLVKTGLTTRAIAKQLGLSVSTIELHRYHILRKLQMKRSTSLINYLSSSQSGQTNLVLKAR